MPKPSAIAQQVYQTIAEYLKRDTRSLHPELTLRDDLGLDSIATIELLYQLEERFDLTIPDQDLEKLHTLRDVIAYLEQRVKLPPQPAAAHPPAAAKSKKRKA